jgi:5'-deoxynucleotidase YfbR-like HD superfamily hydrolase
MIEKEDTGIIEELINGVRSYYYPDEPWIQTHTGRRFNATKPIPESIDIEDIAHALSMQCRFSGHTNVFYSVAQHSVLVSYICDSLDKLNGLLHDASEAYLVDIPKPIKRSGKFDNYLEFERVMEKAIAKRFNIVESMPSSVKRADNILLATEARDLMSPLHPTWEHIEEPLPFKIIPLSHEESKSLFLKRFRELTK